MTFKEKDLLIRNHANFKSFPVTSSLSVMKQKASTVGGSLDFAPEHREEKVFFLKKKNQWPHLTSKLYTGAILQSRNRDMTRTPFSLDLVTFNFKPQNFY